MNTLVTLAATLCGAAVGLLVPILFLVWTMAGNPDAGIAFVLVLPVAGFFSIAGMMIGRLLGLRLLARLAGSVSDHIRGRPSDVTPPAGRLSLLFSFDVNFP